MLHPEHPWAKKSSISLEELPGVSLIWQRTNHGLKGIFTKEFQSRFLVPPEFLYHSYQTAHSLVQKNGGIVLLSSHCQGLLSKEFVFLPVETASCRRKQFLFWRKDWLLTEEETVFF